jgi:MFS transporter, SP family, sugar:H+ symporter
MTLFNRSMLDFSYITKHFNRNLTLAWALIALSTFNFAFDQQGFNSTQAMAAFTKEFGVMDPVTQTWAIPTYFLSLLQSLVYVGYVVGTFRQVSASMRL